MRLIACFSKNPRPFQEAQRSQTGTCRDNRDSTRKKSMWRQKGMWYPLATLQRDLCPENIRSTPRQIQQVLQCLEHAAWVATLVSELPHGLHACCRLLCSSPCVFLNLCSSYPSLRPISLQIVGQWPLRWCGRWFGFCVISESSQHTPSQSPSIDR